MSEKNMAEKSMDKWKQKYLSNLDQLERQEQELKEVESLMRHGIARLSLLATGADDELDGQLEELRKSVRGPHRELVDLLPVTFADQRKRREDRRWADSSCFNGQISYG